MRAARSSFWRNEPGNLILAWNQVVRKNAFEPPLFVLVMKQDYGSYPQGMPACTARRHFAMQVLEETIGKMVLIRCAPRRLYAAFTAVWTSIFQSVFLGVASERGPARITNPNSLF